MPRTITQRQLRNDSGDIMRALDRGESFVVTRSGTPVGQLAPLRRRRFTPAEAAVAAFDAAAARAYGRVDAAVAAAGRKARGPRALDLLIAATALAAGIPVYTRNAENFRGLEQLLKVVAV